ncbi:MAG: Asp-tRNA(Asn)/Glu-tRNA(Gln) amidotransferase subunit GatB [Victivallales bacterium]|nr:Asp-tRNA(Asn)/Glu-tRNA(Gln) amidotransferase subunit GatB [Victivallales bacterium]
MAEYEVVIGLEVHVQIKTRSKMFCSCANVFGAEPNTMVCPVCMGYPGVMPTPNHEAIRKTIMAGLMCDCDIPSYSKFDRKSYFYPDMPKNYQISQYDLPLCLRGRIHISGKGFSGEELPDKYIGLTRIHLEEDVAKLNHLGRTSGVDFNRAGVPLMECVSEPDMRSADEAYAYLTALKQIMQYGGISDCDMEKGQMRCDVNISLRPFGQKEFGTKIELKNLNSFRAVHRAVNYEIARQSELLDAGEKLRQETRGWNDDRGETYLMRTKEQAHDYRYFPEPDLMPITLDLKRVDEYRRQLPELPEAMRRRFVADYGLTPYDAQVLTMEKALAEYYDCGAKLTKSPKTLANWIISDLLCELSASGQTISACPVTPEHLAAMIDMIDAGAINNRIAKTVFAEMASSGKPPRQIVAEKGLAQVSDEGAVIPLVEQAIAANAPQVQQYREGNEKVVQYFVGQVMKLSRGKANPQLVIKLLKERLDG